VPCPVASWRAPFHAARAPFRRDVFHYQHGSHVVADKDVRRVLDTCVGTQMAKLFPH